MRQVEVHGRLPKVDRRVALQQLLVVGRRVHAVEARAEAKVRQLEVAVLVDEQVVRLDVAVDKAGLVDRIDREDGLRHVEPRRVLGERVLLDQQRHHVAAGQELHDEVQVVLVLERVVELHDPRVVGLREQVALRAHVRELGAAHARPRRGQAPMSASAT